MKTLYLECSIPFWFDVAAVLQKEHGWEPVYWTGCRTLKDAALDRFPTMVYHGNYDAARGISAEACADLPPACLDQPLLIELAACESIIMRMMDRMDLDASFNYIERARLYHRLLRYWIAVLDRYEPEIAIFASSPHLIYDFVLYTLCKRRGIRTLIIKDSSMHGLLCVSDSIEAMSDTVRDAYQKLLAGPAEAPVQLSPELEDYLRRVGGDYSTGAPFYLQAVFSGDYIARQQPAPECRKSRWEKLYDLRRYPHYCRIFWTDWVLHPLRRLFGLVRPRRLAGLVRTVVRTASDFCRLLRLVGKYAPLDPARLAQAAEFTGKVYGCLVEAGLRPGTEVPQSYFVRSGEKPERGSTFNGLEHALYRLLLARDRAALKDVYNRFTDRSADLTVPFAFVALNFQPEASTSPDAGSFVELLLMVRLVSQTLPEGWKIYVKEHPFQFHKLNPYVTVRTAQFYEDLVAIPHVKLLPLDRQPFDLIDASRVVVTATGTSAWEAVVRGKPALVFGHPWFVGCEGVFYTPSEEACRAALARILDGYRPDPRKVRLYLRALEVGGRRGYTLSEPIFAKQTGLSPKENARGIADLLLTQARAGQRTDTGAAA